MSTAVSSDYNLQRINTKDLSRNIERTIEFGGNLLAIARRGTGKTTIAKELIKRSNLKEVYLNLSLMERPDLGGYPNFFGAKSGEKYINFLMPSVFKDLIDGDTPCVAILDEIDKADSSLLAPLLEFVQMRSLNGYQLKNLHSIIMTGNLRGEGGQRPPLPLLDRTEKFIVEIDPRHWLDWAGESGEIHPSVAAYIAENLNDLCGEIDPGEVYADTSPRGWHNASKILFFAEKRKWDPEIVLQKVSGCIGKKVGLKYSTFFEHYQVLLPVVEQIMKGNKVADFSGFESTKKLVVCMILCARYARLLDDVKEKCKGTKLIIPSDIQSIGANISKFLSNVDPEIALISVRGQIGPQRVLDFNLTDDENWDRLLGILLSKIGK
jgi:hypothetical protein